MQQHKSPARCILSRATSGFLLGLMALLLLSGSTLIQAQTLRAPSVGAPTTETLILGPDDIVEVTISNHPDLNTTSTIRPDGKITVPRAGDVQAAGRTSQALAAEIQKRLSKRLNNARVTVAVKEVHSRRVQLLGAVNKSGSFELKPGWRFMDLVADAGGLKTKPTRITGRIVRGRTVIPLNIEAAVERPESAANELLQPGDLIVLDERDISKQLNVIGAIAKPGAYDLTEDLSVITLLNEAGGPQEQAALKDAYVQRGETRIPLDLYALLVERRPDAEASRFQFELGDVLVIPANEARFSVMGQVAKPGFYRLSENKEEATALKALAMAGNPLTNADLRNAVITRTVDGQTTTMTVDLESQLMGRAPDDTILEEGDALFIPQRQVHVTGRVAKPGAYDISDGLSVVELMAMAGNALPGAGLSNAYVMRAGQKIPLNLYQVLVAGQPDPNVTNFKLQNGDVLVVPDVQGQLIVMGQVKAPGTYDLDDDLSVLSLVTKAGGVIPGAALKKAYVLRHGTQIPLDLHTTLIEGKADPNVANFKFQAGDVLVLPENQARYAVLGQVKSAGYYPVPENKKEVPVLSALSVAGGPASDANLRDAGIIRTVNGQPTRIPLDLEQMFAKGDKAMEAVQLLPEDVLFIPSKKPNSGSSWTKIMSLIPIIGLIF
jgi:protein involved in polysaccharide export with SLBB domain